MGSATKTKKVSRNNSKSNRNLGKSWDLNIVECPGMDEDYEKGFTRGQFTERKGAQTARGKEHEFDDIRKDLKDAMVKRALLSGEKRRDRSSGVGAGTMGQICGGAARRNDEFFKVLMESKRTMKKRYDL